MIADNQEKLFEEHSQLKERLSSLVDFTNSEEYYKLTDAEKSLMASQRTGMEMYLNALSVRLWGNMNVFNPTSSLMPLLLSMMFPASLNSNNDNPPTFCLPKTKD